MFFTSAACTGNSRAFVAYVLYEIAEFILMFVLYSVQGVTGEQYIYAYCATLLLSIVLRFGVIDEFLEICFVNPSF